jgi:hypothetical protein
MIAVKTNKLIERYIDLLVDYRKAMARRLTLMKQNADPHLISQSRIRELELAHTISTTRKRIRIDKTRSRIPFNQSISKSFACLLIELYFDPMHFKNEVRRTNDIQLKRYIHEMDSILTPPEINSILLSLRAFTKEF